MRHAIGERILPPRREDLLPNQNEDDFWHAVDYILKPRLALEEPLRALLMTAPDPADWLFQTHDRRLRIATVGMQWDVATLSPAVRQALTWETVAMNYAGDRRRGWIIMNPDSLWTCLDCWPTAVMNRLRRPDIKWPPLSWNDIPIGTKAYPRFQQC